MLQLAVDLHQEPVAGEEVDHPQETIERAGEVAQVGVAGARGTIGWEAARWLIGEPHVRKNMHVSCSSVTQVLVIINQLVMVVADCDCFKSRLIECNQQSLKMVN